MLDQRSSSDKQTKKNKKTRFLQCDASARAVLGSCFGIFSFHDNCRLGFCSMQIAQRAARRGTLPHRPTPRHAALMRFARSQRDTGKRASQTNTASGKAKASHTQTHKILRSTAARTKGGAWGGGERTNKTERNKRFKNTTKQKKMPLTRQRQRQQRWPRLRRLLRHAAAAKRARQCALWRVGRRAAPRCCQRRRQRRQQRRRRWRSRCALRRPL